MTQASLAALKALMEDLEERCLKPATCGDIAQAINPILDLFVQTLDEFDALGQCIDDLALHTGYQLRQKDGEAANG